VSKLIIKTCSCHDIAESLLKLALNTNQSIKNVQQDHKSKFESVIKIHKKTQIFFITDMLLQYPDIRTIKIILLSLITCTMLFVLLLQTKLCQRRNIYISFMSVRQIIIILCTVSKKEIYGINGNVH
jgi:hypothetical protein